MAERCGLTMLLMFTDSDGCEKTGSESGYSCKTGKVIFLHDIDVQICSVLLFTRTISI